MVNVSRIAIDEKQDLLLSLSVLIKKKQVEELEEFLKNKENFHNHLSGPFAPYSFVENG